MRAPVGVFLVDDDADMRLLVRITLEFADESLRIEGEAETGDEAIGKLRELNPDVVVLDQMLPDVSGLEIAAMIRELWPHLPIVLFSAFIDETARTAAAAVGIARVCGKEDINLLPAILREVVSS